MDFIPQSPASCKNLLLSLLPEKDYQALLPHLEVLETPMHFKLFERNAPFEYAYFPLIGEHSILATMENGAAVEVGTVGFEGFSTIDLLLGGDVATESTICQIPGHALRLPAAVFRKMTNEDTPLRRIALRYLNAYLSQVSQSVACNRLHAIEQRLARWLLMSHDRMQQPEFQLTQEYLAMMLGVHRPSVSLTAGTLQRAGLVEFKRGRIRIVDRQGLEEVSCECYGIVRDQFSRLLGQGFG
ncbi:Crp/Fnr family transcriptional regulator [Noviherbaspirillum sp.]|uniref:Crp/Fnr family transcriptional regulator n=1 Tax=Noviherbaspirillum sp. TaxID=1926288 RepID=UPI002FDF44D8